jgi:hypothetical protein
MRLSQGFIHLAVGFTFSLIQNFHTPALAQPRLEATGHSATAASESFEPPQAARNPLRLPQVGNHELRILTPTLLELFLVTTKAPDPARVTEWDFVDEKFKLRLPAATEFAVEVNGAKVDVESVGFRRRVIYAPLKQRDLRIGNALFLELTRPIPEGAEVEVFNPGGRLWGRRQSFQAVLNPQRWTPAIHVNHVGYHRIQAHRRSIGRREILRQIEIAARRRVYFPVLSKCRRSGFHRIQNAGRVSPARARHWSFVSFFYS